MNQLVITLRSGTQIRVDATEFSTSRNPVHGHLAELTWTTPNDWASKLHYVDIGEVAAIHIETATSTADDQHDTHGQQQTDCCKGTGYADYAAVPCPNPECTVRPSSTGEEQP